MNTPDSPAFGGPRRRDVEDLQVLRREHRDWGVWRSGTGRWWAYRTSLNPLTLAQMRAGCRLIVHADSLTDLRKMIEVEARAAQRVR